jgi:glyoxylase-like metal-dependent hydrolase (beta-lactamase superfamily II)
MQITDHIYTLHIPFRIPAGPGQALERFVNVFPVLGVGRVGLVDSGVAGSERAIFDYLAAQGHAPGEIELLVLTHAHPDHIGAAAAIKGATGCAVAAHAAERAWIEDVDLQARERPMPGFAGLVGGSVTVDRLLADGETLDLAGLPATVLHTPGHSHGSISLWFPSEGVLITGDAVPRPDQLPIYDDVRAAMRSIAALWRLPDLRTLLSSWDEPQRGEEAYLALEEGLQYIVYIHEVVQKVSKAGPLEPMELCRRVVEQMGLPPSAVNPLTARTLLAHLAVREIPVENLAHDK